jgi:hypothetical protein
MDRHTGHYPGLDAIVTIMAEPRARVASISLPQHLAAGSLPIWFPQRGIEQFAPSGFLLCGDGRHQRVEAWGGEL